MDQKQVRNLKPLPSFFFTEMCNIPLVHQKMNRCWSKFISPYLTPLILLSWTQSLSWNKNFIQHASGSICSEKPICSTVTLNKLSRNPEFWEAASKHFAPAMLINISAGQASAEPFLWWMWNMCANFTVSVAGDWWQICAPRSRGTRSDSI